MLDIQTFFNALQDTTEAPLRFNESGLYQFDDLYDTNPSEICGRIFDVRNFLPYWLVQEHENGNTLLIKFLQYYYDWLYCSDASDLYVDNITDLFDIENIKEETKSAFIRSFIPQLEPVLDEHTVDQIKNFIFRKKLFLSCFFSFSYSF